MQYWLHRIAYLQNVSHPLLDKDYLSIGFSDFCTDEFFEMVAENQNWNYLENDFNECWGYLPRNRYNLWRFLAEMNKGDWVIVPSWGTFSIYELCDDLPIMATDDEIAPPKEDWNGKTIIRDTKTGFLKLEGDKNYLDIGFLRKVKLIYKDISRTDYADAALTSRMKIRNTNANISDLEENIQKALSAYKNNRPINLKADILENTVDVLHKIILDKLNPDKFEKLVKWYFLKIGASESYIPPKNYEDKTGDVDVVAMFENIKTIINVQVKFYQGETSDWAITQIKDFFESKENMSDGYNRQYWVISSSDSFSEKSYKLAKENSILLIDGKQFIEMLLNAGIETLDSFEN